MAAPGNPLSPASVLSLGPVPVLLPPHRPRYSCSRVHPTSPSTSGRSPKPVRTAPARARGGLSFDLSSVNMESASAWLGYTPLAEYQAASTADGQRAPRPHPPESAEPKPVPAARESARQSTCRPALGARRAPGARRCIGGARAAYAEGVRQGKRRPCAPGYGSADQPLLQCAGGALQLAREELSVPSVW